MRPIIGVIPLWDDEKESIWMLPGYMKVLEANGAIPIVFPMTSDEKILDKCFDMVDGILFTGGHDVNPELYGEAKKDYCGLACDARDNMEKYLFNRALESDMPILGICRGIQLFNALLGGTLYQDLPIEKPSQTKHAMTKPYDRGVHEVEVLKDTFLAGIIGTEKISVNSYHHQAIKDLAPNLIVNAISEDGLVEAVNLPDKKFVFAIQWHPEFMWQVCDRNNQIVKAFVQAIINYR